MNKSETICFPVPEGYPCMSLPTEASNRFSNEDIILSPAKEDDLLSIAEGMYTCFPEVWWSQYEPHSRRPPQEVRVERLAKRFKPLLAHHATFTFLVAKIKETGEFAGAAGWHHPVPGGFSKNMWLCDIPGSDWGPLRGWYSGVEYGKGELEELWEAVEVQLFASKFEMYEMWRRDIMGGEAHWYLAPLIVLPQFGGRGIGRLLLQWAIDQADAQNPPTPIYVESFPNARPVYLHLGFQPKEDEGKQNVLVRRG